MTYSVGEFTMRALWLQTGFTWTELARHLESNRLSFKEGRQCFAVRNRVAVQQTSIQDKVKHLVRRDTESARWESVNILLSADVLVLLRVAGHFSDADAVLDVFELQAEVLARDGQHGSPLPGARLWIQLVGRTDERGHMLAWTWRSIFFFFTQKQYIIEHIMYVGHNDSLLKSLWSSPILRVRYLLPHYRRWKMTLDPLTPPQLSQTFTTCQLTHLTWTHP